MPTSSIPAVIDYLVQQIVALPECAAPCTVHDGFPVATGNPAVAIGVVPHEDGNTPNDVVHAQLGAQMEWETYNVPCVVSAWVGGGDEASKPARDAAFRVYDAIVTLVRADRTLGGNLHSGAAIVTQTRVDQAASAEQAGEGRSCAIAFVVNCKNRF